MKVKIINKSNNPLPEYKTAHSAGMDLRANLPKHPFIIDSGKIVRIPTGIHIELPEGYEAQVRPRSGCVLKGLDVKLGTIDADYRGEVCVILHNVSRAKATINHGDRIAQMVISKFEKVEWTTAEHLSETERGTGGFGHTGIK